MQCEFLPTLMKSSRQVPESRMVGPSCLCAVEYQRATVPRGSCLATQMPRLNLNERHELQFYQDVARINRERERLWQCSCIMWWHIGIEGNMHTNTICLPPPSHSRSGARQSPSVVKRIYFISLSFGTITFIYSRVKLLTGKLIERF